MAAEKEKTIKKESYLTETILSVYNDVQSAIDFIDEVAYKQGTELGKGRAAVGIEKLRIKMPVAFEIEQKRSKVKMLPEEGDRNTILGNLVRRKGFLTDIGEPGKIGLHTKIKVLPPQEKKEELMSERPKAEQPAQPASPLGEIEIIFVPMSRNR